MIFLIAKVIFVVLFLLFLKLHAIPFLKIMYLKRKYKDKIEVIFNIGPSLAVDYRKNYILYGDSEYTFKNVLAKNPNAKAILFKHANGSIGYVFVDPQYYKEIHQNINSFTKLYKDIVLYHIFS